MGKNYYRIPKSDDVNRSYQKFMSRLQDMDRWNPSMILNGYRFIENPENEWEPLSPWDEFTDGYVISTWVNVQYGLEVLLELP